jgi:hypothetical protein
MYIESTTTLTILQISNVYHKTFQIVDCTMTNIQNFSLAKIVNFVPYGASRSILLKILDFWGRLWGIWIFINFNELEDKLHYCNKSCDIFMIVGFHLLCFAPGLVLVGNAKFKSVFFPLEYRFLLETPGACISPLLFSCNALCKAFWEK